MLNERCRTYLVGNGQSPELKPRSMIARNSSMLLGISRSRDIAAGDQVAIKALA
jgi:hypothetical protein